MTKPKETTKREKKCRQCELENNRGLCDKKGCSNNPQPSPNDWFNPPMFNFETVEDLAKFIPWLNREIEHAKAQGLKEGREEIKKHLIYVFTEIEPNANKDRILEYIRKVVGVDQNVRSQLKREAIDSLVLEIEAWMDVHQERQQTFKTEDLIDHLKQLESQ